MNKKPAINYKYISESFLEALALPVFIVNCTLTIHYCNQSALRLYNVTERSQAKQLEQLIHDTAILQLVQQSIHTNSPHNGSYEEGQSDVRWQISVAPLAHQSRRTMQQATGDALPYYYFAVIIEDMTGTRRLERMQRDFLANISHELRTPLTAVRLLAETLEDTIDTNPDKAQEFVEKIEAEVQYLDELVTELLELTRIEAGQMLMTIEPIEAQRLVLEVMARMLPLAQRHRVKLSTDIQQGLTLVVADSKQIMRVLVNLVHNAIKFTPSGGHIVIGTAPKGDQHTQCFFVRDSGVGIRQEELPRVFERFYKTDRARAKAGFTGPGGGGTGLGLAIARHVVEAHGGRISAESAVGVGSTFTFTLPVATQADTQDAQKPSTA